MAAAAAKVLTVLNVLKEKIKDAEVIEEVRYDDKAVRNFRIEHFDLDIRKLEVKMKFKPEGGGDEIKVDALHYFRSDKPDVIKINGDDASHDDVDVDVDTHFLRADVEYRLRYRHGGRRHEVFMLAKVHWSL